MGRFKIWQHRLGLPMAFAGVGMLSSDGLKEMIVAAVNNFLNLGLDVHKSAIVGWILLGLGLALLIWGEFIIHKLSPLPFIGFYHHSLLGHSTGMNQQALSKNCSSVELRQIECDETHFFLRNNFDAAGAVRLCVSKMEELAAARKLYPEAPVGYYGLAHVPLQFAAGFLVSSQAKILLFEQDRDEGSWAELQRSSYLADIITSYKKPHKFDAAVIRLAVSYNIPIEEVKQVISGDFADYFIGLRKPKIDAITSYDQISQLCMSFRELLDEIHHLGNPGVVTHVFYAGPACLGFSLGRQINKNIHFPVLVHQYDAAKSPRYAWSVEIAGLSPQQSPTISYNSPAS